MKELVVELNAASRKDLNASDTSPVDGKLATAYDVKDLIVLPRTKDVLCPRDGQMGAIFVDTLSDDANVGTATAILSYA